MPKSSRFRFVPCSAKGLPGYEIHHGDLHLGWTGRVPPGDEDAPAGWWRLWPNWGDEPSYSAGICFKLRETGAERLLEHHAPRMMRSK